ncbi:hypothetical protein ABRY23_13160 [Melioribacteraceae bacterium 4301-Me]|uniref:hypothetical protein n=1 Tax=Pyranulibacter aquaticus TaxID=3163344 RepID=UPI0035956C45
MKTISRLLLLFATLMITGLFFFPIWNIDLHAPQYPEGIGLRIWLNKITGEKPFDLININKLNHYIGMKPIVPESIPELKYMPYIVAGIILFGMLVILLKKRQLVFGWIASIVVIAIIGLYDFYMWGYHYGHNLSPEAPIKVPGMTYQPPLIGSKQLLNMKAESLPGIGGILLGLAVLIAIAAIIIDKRELKGN